MESHLLCFSNKKVAAVPEADVSNCLVTASAGLWFSGWAYSQRRDSSAAAERRRLTELLSHSRSQRFAKCFLTPATAQVQNPPEHVWPPALYPSSVTGFKTMPHFPCLLSKIRSSTPSLSNQARAFRLTSSGAVLLERQWAIPLVTVFLVKNKGQAYGGNRHVAPRSLL